jgi:hypothetical protein
MLVDSEGVQALQGCGILYVASMHDRFVEQAFLSAESVKQRPTSV